MRIVLFSIGLIVASTLLGSCATMSAEECVAGDWNGRGFSDGAAGYAQSRLGEHAEACSKHGIAPDDNAYRAGWAQGVLRYCTLPNGFAQGRSGAAYNGVCPSNLEVEFLPAYQDGQIVYSAEQAVSNARSSVDSLGGRLAELDDKIEAKQRELRADGLTDEQRDQIRGRIQEIRREREGTERDWRRAQREIDDAERNARDVRYRFQRQYGAW